MADSTYRPWTPSTNLPPLTPRQLTQLTTSSIALALQSLRSLYWPTSTSIPQAFSYANHPKPPKALSRIRNDELVPDSGYASADDEDSDDIDKTSEFSPYASASAQNYLHIITKPSYVTQPDEDDDDHKEIIRADIFERSFAIKWITGFISRSDTWIYATPDEDDNEARSHLVDIASQILSAFSGIEPEDEEEAALTRTFSFPLAVDSQRSTTAKTLDVQLNDAALLSEDHTSVGLQSWGSAIILAERICSAPQNFFGSYPTSTKKMRILELGAGTGLLSIVAAKLLIPSSSTMVVATDYHPDVLINLSENINANFPVSSESSTPSTTPVSVHKLDWKHPTFDEKPFDEPFDVILAADVVYDPHHAEWIRNCVERLLVKPEGSIEDGGVFWLLIPLRSTGRHEGLYETVDTVFPDTSSVRSSRVNRAGGGDEWKLAVMEREEIQRRSGGVGRADEVGYRLFKIGWVNG